MQQYGQIHVGNALDTAKNMINQAAPMYDTVNLVRNAASGAARQVANAGRGFSQQAIGMVTNGPAHLIQTTSDVLGTQAATASDIANHLSGAAGSALNGVFKTFGDIAAGTSVFMSGQPPNHQRSRRQHL